MRFVNRQARREKRALARALRRQSTPEEEMLWNELRTHKLSGLHFRRQHVLRGFIVDFYCSSANLVIELDGNHHGQQIEADRERDAILAALGNQVLRFPNSEVRENLASVLIQIRKSVAQH